LIKDTLSEVELASIGSTAVEDFTRDPKVDGSSPTSAFGSETKKIAN
jgi:hypothetical protein